MYGQQVCREHHLGHVALFFVTWLVRGLIVFGQDVFCPDTTDMGDWALNNYLICLSVCSE